MTSFESQLRERMATATRDISDVVDFDAVADQVAVRRRRTSARAALGVAGVAAAAVVAVSLGHVGDSDSGGLPVTRPTTTESRGATQQEPPDTGAAYDWAMSLPRGRDAKAAWEADGAIHLSANTIPLPNIEFAIIGETPSGLLLNTFVKGVPDDSRLALATGTGGLQYLPVNHGPHEALENELSPDGTQITYRDGVIDTATGNLVADYPANAVEMVAWTPAGIVYDGRQHTQWLWTPGQAPEPIALPGDVLSSGYSRGTSADGCSQALRIVNGAIGPATVSAFETCDHHILAVATDGALAVATNGDVIARGSGDVVSTLPLPPEAGTNVVVPMLWESPDDLLLSVASTAPSRDTVLVRCSIPSSTCERATEPHSDGSGEFDAVPLSVGWTESQSYYR